MLCDKKEGSYLRVEDKGMSQCDNMLVSGSCGISLLQQLWGIFKYIISCGCCSGSKMHFALQCLCSLIILACFPEECKQEQECWLRTVYISGKVSRSFLGWRNSTFFVQELFSWLISWGYYEERRCPSQRKASYILYMEFFSNEGLTRFAPLAIYLAYFLSFEHEKDMGQMWPFWSSYKFFFIILYIWIYMYTYSFFLSPYM